MLVPAHVRVSAEWSARVSALTEYDTQEPYRWLWRRFLRGRAHAMGSGLLIDPDRYETEVQYARSVEELDFVRRISAPRTTAISSAQRLLGITGCFRIVPRRVATSSPPVIHAVPSIRGALRASAVTVTASWLRPTRKKCPLSRARPLSGSSHPSVVSEETGGPGSVLRPNTAADPLLRLAHVRCERGSSLVENI